MNHKSLRIQHKNYYLLWCYNQSLPLLHFVLHVPRWQSLSWEKEWTPKRVQCFLAPYWTLSSLHTLLGRLCILCESHVMLVVGASIEVGEKPSSSVYLVVFPACTICTWLLEMIATRVLPYLCRKCNDGQWTMVWSRKGHYRHLMLEVRHQIGQKEEFVAMDFALRKDFLNVAKGQCCQ